MASFQRKLKEEFIEKIDFETLKLSELKKMCDEYDVPTSGTKEELVKRLTLCQDDKYVKPPVYETIGGKHLVGVHIRDKKGMEQIATLRNRNEARWRYFSCDFHYYETNEKIRLV